MSIFRNKPVRSGNRPKSNRRRDADVVAGKSTGNVKSKEIRKNRKRLADVASVRRKPTGNRRAASRNVAGDAVNDGDGAEIKIRRQNRRTHVDPGVTEGNELESNDALIDSREPSRWLPILWGTLRVLAVAATVAVVVWGARVVYRYALTSAYFEVQHVEINGNDRLSNREILAAAGIEMGQNIFEVKLAEVIHRLEETPWIMEARAAQKLPKTITIDIVERKPELLVLFDVPYLVDESGEIFKRWVPGDPMPECVITGLTHQDLVEDQEGAQQVILDAISLRERYHEAGNTRYATLYEIHHEIDGGFSLTLGKKPFYVKLGKPPYRKKLNRLAQLFLRIGKSGRQPLIVYFDNEKRPDRVTVKFKPEEVARPATP